MIEIIDTIYIPYPRPDVFEAARLFKLLATGDGVCFESSKRKINIGVLLGVSMEGFSKLGDIKGEVKEFIPNESVKIIGGSRFADLSMSFGYEDFKGGTNASYDFSLWGSNHLGKAIIGGFHDSLVDKIGRTIVGSQDNMLGYLEDRMQAVA